MPLIAVVVLDGAKSMAERPESAVSICRSRDETGNIHFLSKSKDA